MSARRASLLYPGGASPGFDPTHVAARNTRLSAVAVGANFVDMQVGTPGTLAGVPTKKIFAGIGNSVTGYSTTIGVSFTGKQTTPDAANTQAFILNPTALGSNSQELFTLSGTNFSSSFLTGTTGTLNLRTFNQTDVISTLAVAANLPSFIVISTDNSTFTNFLVLNLRTGKVQTQSTATVPSTPTGTQGTFNIGGPNGSFGFFTGGIAACMFAGNAMSLPAMLAWAADPWSFWYPNVGNIRPAWFSQPAAAGGSFIPAWAIPCNQIPSGGYAT